MFLAHLAPVLLVYTLQRQPSCRHVEKPMEEWNLAAFQRISPPVCALLVLPGSAAPTSPCCFCLSMDRPIRWQWHRTMPLGDRHGPRKHVVRRYVCIYVAHLLLKIDVFHQPTKEQALSVMRIAENVFMVMHMTRSFAHSATASKRALTPSQTAYLPFPFWT